MNFLFLEKNLVAALNGLDIPLSTLTLDKLSMELPWREYSHSVKVNKTVEEFFNRIKVKLKSEMVYYDNIEPHGLSFEDISNKLTTSSVMFTEDKLLIICEGECEPSDFRLKVAECYEGQFGMQALLETDFYQSL